MGPPTEEDFRSACELDDRIQSRTVPVHILQLNSVSAAKSWPTKCAIFVRGLPQGDPGGPVVSPLWIGPRLRRRHRPLTQQAYERRTSRGLLGQSGIKRANPQGGMS